MIEKYTKDSKIRDNVYHSFRSAPANAGDAGHDLDRILPGVWHRWQHDHLPSHFAERESGAGA